MASKKSWDQVAKEMTAFERGRFAAWSIGLQKRLLARARLSLKNGQVREARSWLAQWQIERDIWSNFVHPKPITVIRLSRLTGKSVPRYY